MSDLLNAGIKALKTGDKTRAKDLFLKVIEQDEENERAWLWLSGAVEDKEERIICLENVLTLDPDNKAAQKGLAKLGISPPPSQLLPPPDNNATTRKQRPALSLASEILYPERQTQELPYDESALQVEQPHKFGFQADSDYDDVWAKDGDICGYCAHELKPTQNRCPNCKRNLIQSALRYPNTTKHHFRLMVILVIAIFFYLAQSAAAAAFLNYLIAAVPLCLAGIAGILLLGVYLRQKWAYYLMLLYLLPTTLIGFLFNAVTDNNSSTVSSVLPLVINIGVTLFFFYGIFMAGTDFSRVRVRQTAQVWGGSKTADQYDDIGKRLAKKGLWATAVLHWGRAAGKEPHRSAFSRRMAEGYDKLGFYQRALDAYEDSLRVTRSEQVRAEVLAEIEKLKGKMPATS